MREISMCSYVGVVAGGGRETARMLGGSGRVPDSTHYWASFFAEDRQDERRRYRDSVIALHPSPGREWVKERKGSRGRWYGVCWLNLLGKGGEF